MRLCLLITILGLILTAPAVGAAESIAPDVQAKIDALVKTVEGWAADATIVDAVKQANETPSDEAKAMTEDKWKDLTITAAFIRSLTSNAAAKVLKAKKSEVVSEAFISAADGTKVAFLAKTTSWCHKGKAKHDTPMTGKNWQGKAEVDDSSGVLQVQISVPIKHGDKVIGSLVVGLNLTKLAE